MIVATLALAGCARTPYDVADLQLDVEAPLPGGAESLRVCVVDAGELVVGAGNGRAAFTGLPAGEPAVVTLDVLDDTGALLGQAGPVTLDAATPWRTVPLAEGALVVEAEPCADRGSPAPEGADTWLLALRFAEEGPWVD